ncbi:hypothetical protein WN51_11884 [Melipona quadrifasciata]|uniref:Uncharacterized protein n=1 Tax=Melipona quadrifasciata TaxID=166423 RepID=A0A0N0U5W4_9HYME|nr:hypothetical protein WN51_11884 [Melipona quadrifasciata]
MIERWHRSLKTAIRCHENKNWLEVLPTVMLGLRNSCTEVQSQYSDTVSRYRHTISSIYLKIRRDDISFCRTKRQYGDVIPGVD